MNILSALKKVTTSIKTWVDGKLENKLDKNLGENNSGKVLAVGNNGDVEPQLLDTGIVVLSGTDDNPINIDEIKTSGTYLIKGTVTTSMDTTSGSDSAKLNKIFMDGFACGELMSVYSLQDGFINQFMMNPTRPLVRLDSGEGYSDAIDTSYIQPVEKTTEMTQQVGMRRDGQLFTKPFSQVQSDWNQNDITSNNYIQNRPFYKDTSGTNLGTLQFTATGENTIKYTYSDSDSSIFDALFAVYTNKQELKVIIVGKEFMPSMGFSMGVFFFNGTISGNLYWMNQESTLTINDSEISLVSGNVYDVTFYNMETKYYKIDINYIPDEVYTTLKSPVHFGDGVNSAVQGYNTQATKSSAHAEGYFTRALSSYQHAEGRYNIEDADGKYAHIIGNGSNLKRSNAHTLDWSGNAWFAGGVKIGGTGQDDAAAKTIATKDDIDAAKPKSATVTLLAANWVGDASPYSQVITISGVTANSRIDLQPTPEQLAELQNKDAMLMIANDNGVTTAYILNYKPIKDYEIQISIIEMSK